MTGFDAIFSTGFFATFSPDFRGLVLLNCTQILEKRQKIQWRASSGDGAPKLQISVPCRGRTCPDAKHRNKITSGVRWRTLWKPQNPEKIEVGERNSLGRGLFAYSWKLPAYSGAFLLTVDNFSLFACSFSFFAYSWSFLTYSWKVRLIRSLRDCMRRSLTVSKKAPSVSKKASPNSLCLCLFKAA